MNKNRFAAVLSVLLLSLSLPASAQTQIPAHAAANACAARVQDPIDIMRDPIDVLGARTCPATLTQDPIDTMRDPIDVMSIQP